MSRTLLSLAGFQVIITGRFWVIAEACLKNRKIPVPNWGVLRTEGEGLDAAGQPL